MKVYDILDAVGQISDDLIEEADRKPGVSAVKLLIPLAACICLIIGILSVQEGAPDAPVLSTQASDSAETEAVTEVPDVFTETSSGTANEADGDILSQCSIDYPGFGSTFTFTCKGKEFQHNYFGYAEVLPFSDIMGESGVILSISSQPGRTGNFSDHYYAVRGDSVRLIAENRGIRMSDEEFSTVYQKDLDGDGINELITNNRSYYKPHTYTTVFRMRTDRSYAGVINTLPAGYGEAAVLNTSYSPEDESIVYETYAGEEITEDISVPISVDMFDFDRTENYIRSKSPDEVYPTLTLAEEGDYSVKYGVFGDSMAPAYALCYKDSVQYTDHHGYFTLRTGKKVLGYDCVEVISSQSGQIKNGFYSASYYTVTSSGELRYIAGNHNVCGYDSDPENDTGHRDIDGDGTDEFIVNNNTVGNDGRDTVIFKNVNGIILYGRVPDNAVYYDFETDMIEYTLEEDGLSETKRTVISPESIIYHISVHKGDPKIIYPDDIGWCLIYDLPDFDGKPVLCNKYLPISGSVLMEKGSLLLSGAYFPIYAGEDGTPELTAINYGSGLNGICVSFRKSTSAVREQYSDYYFTILDDCITGCAHSYGSRKKERSVAMFSSQILTATVQMR